MSFDRRRVLRAGVSAWSWVAFGAEASAQTAAPRLSADGFRLFRAGPAKAQILEAPVPVAEALGYEGATPGPLLRLPKGAELKVRLINELSQPTTLCWQGLRIANAMAGIGGLTQPPVPPGASFDYRFTPPDSGFNLYRPYAGAATPGQIGRGLYGPIVVEEASPPALDLEVIAALADWRVGADGAVRDDLTEPGAGGGSGDPGARVFVNNGATPLALHPAPGARVRLRLANAAGRVMVIGVAGMKPLIIALDGQPCEPFEPMGSVFPIGPGARFDLMFDMPGAGADVRFVLLGGGGEPNRPLIVLSATGDKLPPRPPLAGLDANPLLPVEIDLARAKRVDMVIGGGSGVPFSINGATLSAWPTEPLFRVARGAPVTLGLINKTAVAQAIRLHGHVMRLLHPLDDGWEPYWRDSVLIAPGKISHVAFVADNPGVWPIESAIPAHQAAGVMTTFAVDQ